MRSILAALCVVAAGMPLFAAAEPVDPAVAEAIRRGDDALARADAARDVAATMEIYADDVVFFPAGEEPMYGKAAVRRWIAHRASDRKAAREQFEAATLDVCGDLAVETGTVAAEEAGAGGALATRRTPRIAVWKRQADGTWKIGREMRGGEAPSTPPAGALPAPANAAAAPIVAPTPAAPPAAPAAVPEPVRLAPPTDVIAIPDPRGLSEGFVRTIGDRLRSRAAKIRSLQSAGGSGEALRAARSHAARELQTTIRDVGWIDVARFGVATSCDAAFIVVESGDAALVRSAVPWMKDLETNPEGAECYARALEAYRKLK